MIRTYYSLMKPGMIRGNAIITAAGFIVASHGHINISLFILTIIGISFVIASGCVTNNFFDRHIDAKMPRTKNRAFPKQEISGSQAILFAVILGILGFTILALFTNLIVVILAGIGALVYIGLYTPLKHTTQHAALVGSISGAVPIAVGYCAVTHIFDITALVLFLILLIWQIPHFFAISLYRIDEYKAAGVPIFPLQEGIMRTKFVMLVYISLFIVATFLLMVIGIAGFISGIILFLLGIIWFIFCLLGFKTTFADKKWARGMFIYSLVVIMIFSVVISLGSLR